MSDYSAGLAFTGAPRVAGAKLLSTNRGEKTTLSFLLPQVPPPFAAPGKELSF